MRSIFKEDYFNNIFSSIKQKSKWAYDRITKGYCEYDSYEVNSWFLETAPDLIDIVEKNMEGTVTENFISNFLDEHYDTYHLTYDQYQFGTNKNKQDEIFDICVKEYHKILKEMSFYLNEANPEKCSKINEYQSDYYVYLDKAQNIAKMIGIKNENGDIIINTNNPSFVELDEENKYLICKYGQRDKEIRKYQQNCKEKGLRLFVKYFDDLGW